MSTSNSEPVYFDPYLPEITANPYPVFRRLREEAPLYYNEAHDFYALSRYQDVERALQDRETYSSARGNILELIKANTEIPSGLLIFEDPPAHTGHRGLLSRIFTPKRMSVLEPKIRELCTQCLDPLIGQDRFDFVQDLGAKMPMQVIGMLLGIPDEDLQAVRRSTDNSVRTERGKPMDTRDRSYSGEGFDEYIEWRVKHPSDDVMTELLNAEFKDAKGETRKLHREELQIMCNVLAGAGNETTNRLIGWMGKLLAENPEQRQRVIEDPGLATNVVEETLRLEPSGPHAGRYVTRDVELHGRKVPAGSVMMLMMGAANRDDRRFAEPDRFDLDRPRQSHLAFGSGIHTCVGMALARLEGRIALEEVLKRFHAWDVDYANAELSPTSTVRGWDSMPVFLNGAKSSATPSSKPADAAVAPTSGTTTIEGIWNLTIKSPTGPVTTVLKLESANGVLSGTQTGQGSTSVIGDARLEGNKISWINKVTTPMKMKVEFSGTVTGNSIEGKAKAGFMGSYSFSAVKQ